jgi:hypothetical protein
MAITKKPDPFDRFTGLRQFVEQNAGIDFSTIDLTDPESVAGLSWKGMENRRESILELLRPHQRLIRLVPAERPELVYTLLNAGLHSALQIAAIPRQKFLSDYLELFDDDHTCAENIYERALAVRSDVVRRYLDVRQRHEPHVNLARINAPPEKEHDDS